MSYETDNATAARSGLAVRTDAIKNRLSRFRREEDGAATIFTLFILFFMLIMAGIGVDLMRHEMERTHLQATLDSAVLAGASAPTEKTAEEIKAIVEDYFDKAGMSEYLNEIQEDDIETSLNANKVVATADMEIDTYLMKLSGIETLGASGAAAAEITVPKMEISLVLDVSGSMGNNNKLGNLQTAAKEFVSTILASSDPGHAVISLIPFSWGVTPSDGIYNALSINETHNYSTCLRFSEANFAQTAIDPNTTYDQRIYTSRYGGFQSLNSSWRSCYTDDYFRILPYSISETDLHNKIDSLEADGNTSGHEGIKWGAALLDPAFQEVSTSLIAAGQMDSSLTNVPSNYGEAQTLKVIVMMGDGKNTSTYQFNNASNYRGPLSDLFLVKYSQQQFDYAYYIYNPVYTTTNPSACNYWWWECVYKAGGEEVSAYYLRDPDDNDFWDYENSKWVSENEFNNLENTLTGFISAEQLDWEEAWGLITPYEYGDRTGNWSAWNDYVYGETVGTDEKNDRMSASCTAIKNQGVVVYTIGFEIAAGGTAETELKACATSPNYYYPTNGDGIGDAFASIASNVKNLRLTQ